LHSKGHFYLATLGGIVPLSILLILVGGGIGGIALLLHVLGKSQPVVLSDNAARAAWLRLYPEDTVLDVILSGTGHAALIKTDQGLGLVWSFGIDTVARQLDGAEIIETANQLKVRFPDFSAPQALIALSETERSDWRLKMGQT
jgi:hypothetical protein